MSNLSLYFIDIILLYAFCIKGLGGFLSEPNSNPMKTNRWLLSHHRLKNLLLLWLVSNASATLFSWRGNWKNTASYVICDFLVFLGRRRRGRKMKLIFWIRCSIWFLLPWWRQRMKKMVANELWLCFIETLQQLRSQICRQPALYMVNVSQIEPKKQQQQRKKLSLYSTFQFEAAANTCLKICERTRDDLDS